MLQDVKVKNWAINLVPWLYLWDGVWKMNTQINTAAFRNPTGRGTEAYVYLQRIGGVKLLKNPVF